MRMLLMSLEEFKIEKFVLVIIKAHAQINVMLTNILLVQFTYKKTPLKAGFH